MRSQPFHRRILPWIFAIVFIGVAPALVFYTAGYRWNPKKGMIERNGTVIIDSTPANADIQIDDRTIPDKTPVTIQNMAPGTHRFTISKNGYSSWSKSFDVIPEHVVFANDIRLWKNSDPVLALALGPGSMSLSPDDRHLLYVSSATTTRVQLIDLRTSRSVDLQSPDLPKVDSVWSPNGRYVLLVDRDNSQSAWLMDTTNARTTIQLPKGAYRWEGSELIGNDHGALLTIRLSDFSVSREPQVKDHIDVLQQNEIVSPTGTQVLAYVDLNSPTEGFLLPPDAWTFWTTLSDVVLLRGGTDWLSIDKSTDPFRYHTAQGGMLRQDPSTRAPRYLLMNANELWLWDPHADPELLLRDSTAFVDAEWHPDGKNIFYANDQDVHALNLDIRDGRIQTTLAHFDHVYGIVYAVKQLYILASKDGTTGLWSLAVE